MKKTIISALFAGMLLVSCGEVATAVEKGVTGSGECPMTNEYDIYTSVSSLEYEVELVASNSESVPNQIVEIGQPLDDLYEVVVWGTNGCELEHYYFYGV